MKRIVLLLLAFILMLNFTACSSKAESSNGTQSKSKKQQIEGYTVKITQKDKELKSYTIDDIKKLPASKIEVEGKQEEGPSLVDILKDAGVQEYSRLTIKGAYRTEATLTKEQIEKSSILDITNHGTVKLATVAIPKKEWIKDIIEITVEE